MRWLLALTIALCATPASAGIEDTLGLGPRASALAGAYAARPGDFAAVYYNPAGLAPGGAHEEHGFLELAAGFSFMLPSLDINGPGGGEIAPAAPVLDSYGLLLGTRFSLGRAFGVDGLNAGAAVYLPADLFAYETRPDEDIQWLLLSDRAQHLAVDAAIGWRALPWLSIGVGLRVLFDIQTFTRGEVTEVVPETDPDTGEPIIRAGTRLGIDVTVFGRVAPVAGVLATPRDDLRIAFTFRGESLTDDWGDTQVTGVPGIDVLGYTHRFAHYYQPMELAGGLSADLGPLTASAELTWRRWSEALTTNRNAFPSGVFGDTLQPALGLELGLRPGLSLLAGYRFERSPFDNLGGPSNLLDNDRHVGSLGVSLTFAELLADPDWAVRLHAAFQLAGLVEGTEAKDWRRFSDETQLAENPGVAGYTYGGVIPGGSLAVELAW